MNNNYSSLPDLTNPDEIIKNTNDVINEYKESFNNLQNASIKYINNYDRKLLRNMYDGEYLKRKMKETINKAVNDDI